MDKKTTAIVATVATALLCGLPGLLSLCSGAVMMVVSFAPGADSIRASNDFEGAVIFSLSLLCVGVILVAIPIVVGFVMLRKKPTEAPSSDEPLPPAS